ncbi:hypothetical protein HK105_201182 [Polyrhizophydium stewartii]|uniref:Ankyrin repeat protein n=1 Tax=Polyrhizophydium stewartii TaxID=2732419 RepID=A0ABR4NJ17_9FUNG
MPAEIQNMILARAGVLTLWINGRIDDISSEEFKSMVRDVCELDWQGDLSKLPLGMFDYSTLYEGFWHLHSRSLYARFKVLRLSNLDDGLDQAAILNWWTDLLDFGRPAALSQNAARCGSIAMLQHLVDELKVVDLDKEHARLAAEFGHIELLMWLAAWFLNGSWSTGVMDRAAKSGHLNCVKWLHANRTEGCTTDAMDHAAVKGHLNIVKWLHNNRAEGCTTRAMDLAASFGHLEVVKWLHNNRTEGCTTVAMDYAASRGYLQVVKWLHNNRTEGCTTWAMDGAAMNGHLEIVEWLHKNRTEGCSSGAIQEAAKAGHADVVEFLHKNRTEGSIDDAAKIAAQTGQLAVVQRIHSIAPHVITVAVANAAGFQNHISVLEWVIGETGVLPTAETLFEALHCGYFRILPLFRRHRPGIFYSHAASKIGDECADAAIDWFDREDLPSEIDDVIQLAIQERQVVVVKWLLEHLPYRQWDFDKRRQARKLVEAA